MSTDHVVLGTGAIGRAIAEELVKRGESVRMVNRSGKMAEVPAGVEVVAADLYDPAKVKEVTRGAKVVYQSAQPHYYEWPEKFPPLQKSIIEGLTGSGAKLVIVDNLYMYGEVNGKLITEDMPYNAHTRKGQVRAELSEAALAAHRAGKLRVTIGRGSDYFGPWGTDSSMGSVVFHRLLAGKAAQVGGSATMPHTHTYIPDFGKALVILGERTEADGLAWHVPNDMPRVTQGEMIQMVAEAAGVTAKSQVAGKLIMSVLGLFVPELKEAVEMLYEFEKPFVVDSSKFEKTFGMQATPMKDAIKETVAWYKSHPEKK
ncbi:MAG: NAD-dependent epimerase/dehydratase family protein [Chloroflexota bacterium]